MGKPRQRTYYRNPQGKPAGYVTVAEAIEIAHCSEPTLRRWIMHATVRAVHWRSRVLIDLKSLVRWSQVRKYKRAKIEPKMVQAQIKAARAVVKMFQKTAV